MGGWRKPSSDPPAHWRSCSPAAAATAAGGCSRKSSSRACAARSRSIRLSFRVRYGRFPRGTRPALPAYSLPGSQKRLSSKSAGIDIRRLPGEAVPLRIRARNQPHTPHARGHFSHFSRVRRQSRVNSANSHVRAKVQWRSAVASEMPNASAASRMVSPAKNRSLTSSAFIGCCWANLVSASSSATRSTRFVDHDCVGQFQIHPLFAAPPLQCLLAAGRFDQNSPHGLGGGGKKMAAAIPLLGLVVDRPAANRPRAPGPSPAASAPAVPEPACPPQVSAVHHKPGARAALPLRHHRLLAATGFG